MLAGTIWTLVGVVLVVRGLFPYWLEMTRESLTGALTLLAGAVLVGAAKGWFVLRRSARRVLAYIDAHPGSQGLSRIYPRGFYILIPLMIALGLALRVGFGNSLPALVAAVYLAVGIALLGSTAPFFRYWRRGAEAARDASTN